MNIIKEKFYESPRTVFMEMKVEAVLCTSGENDDEYKEVVFPWN